MGRRIEILILLFTGVLIASVLTIGSMLFSNMKVIEKQSEKIYEPNKTILNLKLLLAELRNSENCIKSYSLYNNEESLMEYERSLEEIDRCFDSLYTYQKDHPEASALLDTTESLVEQKVLLMNQQLSLRNEDKVVNEVNTIRIKLDKAVKPDTIQESESGAPKKKRGLFKRLFGKKQKEVPGDTDSIRVVLNQRTINDVKTEVNRVKRRQSNMFTEMKNKELRMTEEDKIIWSKLINILNLLEDKQNEVLKTIGRDNIRETDRMHSLTKIFGGAILALLTFLAILSVYYFNAGRKYRIELSKALEETKVHSKARDTFLATMSHEMRTPLNAITGFTEQLKISDLNAEQKKQIDIIHSASGHLLNLINDILDLSKIESEKINFERIAFNPKEQIDEAVKFLNPKIKDKGLTTTLNFEDNVPDSIIGDPLRLKQVILNLLGNSLKFTNEGGIKINVSALKENPSTGKVNLSVVIEDTGIGIADNMVDKIFDNFIQADSSIIRKYGGTGLGLSITKKIIELQHGEIKLESKLHKGTKIAFHIPYIVNIEQKQEAKEGNEKYMPTIVRGKKVLIADDELFNRVLLTTILKRWDIQFDEAENGNQVLEMVSRNNYDILLMDVRMPEVSGIDATKQIRKFEDKTKANVPIIALTAAVFEERRRSCMEAGMNGMITKPFKESELLRLIETILINSAKDEKV